jgi:hypothetical protein
MPDFMNGVGGPCGSDIPGNAFYDKNSLRRLIENEGLTVVECNGEPGRVSVLARA